MVYDHHKKAGNQGDCVKHPPLIAALDTVLHNKGEKPFHYLDVFAGHGWHPLLDEGEVPGIQKKFEWKSGIGVLHQKLWKAQKLNDHVQLWRDWYLTQRFSLVRGWYPGSSIIAADMCRKHERPIRMTLFDISDEVKADQCRFFQPVQPTDLTRDDWCVIGQSLNPNKIRKGAIQEPEFVFIDPPGWQSDKDPSYPVWEDFLEHVLEPRGDKKLPTVMWTPAGGQQRTPNKNDRNKENSGNYPWDKKSNGKLHKICDDVTKIGYSWTAVRWQKSSYCACILVYNCAVSEIREAIDCITKIAGWEKKHSRKS